MKKNSNEVFIEFQESISDDEKNLKLQQEKQMKVVLISLLLIVAIYYVFHYKKPEYFIDISRIFFKEFSSQEKYKQLFDITAKMYVLFAQYNTMFFFCIFVFQFSFRQEPHFKVLGLLQLSMLIFICNILALLQEVPFQTISDPYKLSMINQKQVTKSSDLTEQEKKIFSLYCNKSYGNPNIRLCTFIMINWIFFFYAKILIKNLKALRIIVQFIVTSVTVIYSCLIFLNGINSIDYVIDSWLISTIIFIFFELYSFQIINDYIQPIISDTIIENQGQFFRLLWFFVTFNLLLYSCYNWGANIQDSAYVQDFFNTIEGLSDQEKSQVQKTIHQELKNDKNPYFVPDGFCQIERYDPVQKSTRDYFSFSHIRDGLIINVFFGAIFSYIFSSRTQQIYYSKLSKGINKHCSQQQKNAFKFISFLFNSLVLLATAYKDIKYLEIYSISLIANMFYYIFIGIFLNVYIYWFNLFVMKILLQVTDEETLKKIEQK